ncbi:MAG: asparagine synthase (glutamine-hydrolyzing) [Phycisphaerales bacterium]|jgi:asparagine synthase (glutamine-hydrolysing)|nr:asparagine synthase (glutamine-hydrolyzing) [Phycisphaerales bacterium]
MCGIAGIIGRVDEANRQALSRMSAAMKHRGPDGEGFWVSDADASGNGCLLAHRRLSILDLSTSASQPMVDPHTGQVIVFNGEIYNYQQLRDELAADGESFQSTGDTAVMLRLLSLHGEQAIERLRGMYAFALWNSTLHQLTLGRDPLGIKPLYVCENPDTNPNRSWSLLFASEVRAILSSGLLVKPRLDPSAVASVIWNGFVMGPGTIVRGISSLWPGQVQVRDAQGKTQSSRLFWNIPKRTNNDADESAVRRALAESVKLHMVSDVPLGVFLSGGIDSSAVANLAQRASDQPVNTFTLAFEEEAYNEGQFARAIAGAIGTKHHEILLREVDFVSNLDRAIESLDQPTFDGLNSYFISRAVRDAGLTVALIGTGGDELFGGYKSFRELPKLRHLARKTGWIPLPARLMAARMINRIVNRGAGDVGAQTRWAKLPDMLRHHKSLLSLYQLAYGLFLPDFQRQLLSGSAGETDVSFGLPAAMRQRLEEETHGLSDLQAISAMELRCFLGQRLLRDTDAASMAVSLEVRLPLVDQVVVRELANVPDELRYSPLGRKMLLRRVGLSGLDPALFDRPKSGFVLPFDRWIRTGLGRVMDQLMRDPAAATAVSLDGRAVSRLWDTFQSGGAGMYWSRVWSIYILMRWCQRHQVTM